MKKKLLKYIVLPVLLVPLFGGCNNQEYAVVFKNYDDSILFETKVKAGHDAVYEGDEPSRDPDLEYSYIFKGWDQSLTKITKDTTFVAQYERTNDYAVRFYDYEGGKIIHTSYVKSGQDASYEGKTPAKPADFDYYYTFKEWDKPFTNVTSHLDVYGTYDQASNAKDFDPTFEYWILKNSDLNALDWSNTSFYNGAQIPTGAGVEVELVKPVVVNGEEVTSHHVKFIDMEIDFSHVDTSTIGEYETTISYRGIEKKEVIDVIPDSEKFGEPFRTYWPGELGPDWTVNAYTEFFRDEDNDEYVTFNQRYSRAYKFQYFDKDGKSYFRFYRQYDGVLTDMVYRLKVSGGDYYFTAYDFPGHVGDMNYLTIVKDGVEHDVGLFQTPEEVPSGYLLYTTTYYTSSYANAIKYEYDIDHKALTICHEDFRDPFTYNEEDGKYYDKLPNE